MAYGALTFDTQTVMKSAFEFNSGLLAQLKQFKNGPIRIVLSDVITREIEKHLAERIKQVRDKIEEAHREGQRLDIVSGKHGPAAAVDATKLANERLATFLREIGAEIIPTKSVRIEEVLRRYFAQDAPFSARSGKQKEFPDAIALLALEDWAQKQKFEILAVSNDKDWSDFATASPTIGHTKDLKDALASFQDNIADAESDARKLLQAIVVNPEGDLFELFANAVVDELTNRHFAFHAESQFDVAQEEFELSVTSIGFPDLMEQAAFRVVAIRSTYLAVAITLNVGVSADVALRISSAQAPIGHVEVCRDVTFAGEFLVTFEGELFGTPYPRISVDLVSGPQSIDLGRIDNDLSDQWAHYG